MQEWSCQRIWSPEQGNHCIWQFHKMSNANWFWHRIHIRQTWTDCCNMCQKLHCMRQICHWVYMNPYPSTCNHHSSKVFADTSRQAGLDYQEWLTESSMPGQAKTMFWWAICCSTWCSQTGSTNILSCGCAYLSGSFHTCCTNIMRIFWQATNTISQRLHFSYPHCFGYQSSNLSKNITVKNALVCTSEKAKHNWSTNKNHQVSCNHFAKL